MYPIVINLSFYVNVHIYIRPDSGFIITGKPLDQQIIRFLQL